MHTTHRKTTFYTAVDVSEAAPNYKAPCILVEAGVKLPSHKYFPSLVPDMLLMKFDVHFRGYKWLYAFTNDLSFEPPNDTNKQLSAKLTNPLLGEVFISEPVLDEDGKDFVDEFMLDEVRKERTRQREKFGTQHLTPTQFLAVLVEEVGEVARAICDGDGYNYQDELIQVAAVAIAAVSQYTKENNGEKQDA